MSASPDRRRLPGWPTVIGVLAAVAVLAGCGSLSSDDAGAPHEGPLRIATSFYPLQWMAGRVGGDLVTVSNLTKPGAEPHDLELTPRDVASLADADVVAYLAGFQPSVDAALSSTGAARFDAAPAADLDRSIVGRTDPHFWLDPTRLADVANAFADTLAEQDPTHARTYRANAADLTTDLKGLDQDLKVGLATCASRDLVTSHRAFGYLGQRYRLRQVGISGLSPDDEPTGRDLARAADVVRANHVRTIYFETLVSPAVARTVARETGARTAILDPLEGVDDRSKGDDYLSVMRANLASLRTGQGCT